MKRMITLGAAILLTACTTAVTAQTAKKPAPVAKTTTVDYKLTVAEFNNLNNLDDAARKNHDGKMIEVSGVIKSGKKASSAAAPNKFFFYLCTDVNQEDTDCVICYSNQDPTANVGKTVTVKGKADDAGVFTLINSTY